MATSVDHAGKFFQHALFSDGVATSLEIEYAGKFLTPISTGITHNFRHYSPVSWVLNFQAPLCMEYQRLHCDITKLATTTNPVALIYALASQLAGRSFKLQGLQACYLSYIYNL